MARRWSFAEGGVLRTAASSAARKFQVALAGAAATAAALWIPDGKLSRDDLVAVAVAFLAALGVFVKSNK